MNYTRKDDIAMSELAESVRENPTLQRLLFALKAADEEIEEINLDEQLEFLEAGKVKVDNYKYVLDKLEVHAAYLKKREHEYGQARKATESNIERIKKHLLYSLEKNGFSKFTGNDYVVAVRKAPPSIVIKDLVEPSPQLKLRYPGLIRTSYDWDKQAIREAIKRGDDPSVAEFAELKENSYVKFSLVKD